MEGFLYTFIKFKIHNINSYCDYKMKQRLKVVTMQCERGTDGNLKALIDKVK